MNQVCPILRSLQDHVHPPPLFAVAHIRDPLGVWWRFDDETVDSMGSTPTGAKGDHTSGAGGPGELRPLPGLAQAHWDSSAVNA